MRKHRHKANGDNLKLVSNQDFGFMLSIIILVVAGYLNSYGTYKVSTLLGFLGGIVALVATVQPKRLYRLNFLWTFTGLLLGKISQTIMLGLIFYLLFLPTGLIMRLCGKDELKLRQKESHTHWRHRQPQNSSLEDTFKNQF
ncbi:SxtJ family membrane protein [Vibrio ruber]|uniref:SxtJ family membrane protein n=1 Tax=Vibrio ruber TaxID=184755 RepID=UPI002892C1A7|nr:SxtJ family membrane protein [Vibrio ruber]WNJ97513.1 SxtJ family membrane protein [Vibrio ruber]